MLILYTSPGCLYCAHVKEELHKAGISLEERDVTTDPAFRSEVISKGGKLQLPFLVDTDRNVCMYESDAIITYVLDTYGT